MMKLLKNIFQNMHKKVIIGVINLEMNSKNNNLNNQECIVRIAKAPMLRKYLVLKE